ncbi:MAG: hypothetical protein ACQERB_17000 [Promethearchaeati archaeon]
MSIELNTLQLLQGSFTLVFVLISVILGFLIISKYFKYGRRQYLLVGITWILLVSPYWPDAISFLLILFTRAKLHEPTYFFIANAFIAPIHITWILVITDFIYKDKQKFILPVVIVEAIAFEILFLIFFFIDPYFIGTPQSNPFVVEWNLFIDLYLIISIALFLITGLLFARESLKSDSKEIKYRGWFLIFAFITFTIGTLIDVILELNEITIVIARLFVIIAAFCFYLGFTMPNFMKKLLIKE